MVHARQTIRDAVSARIDALVPAFEGRVFPGRVGALVAATETPACYVDVMKSKGTELSQESSALTRHFLVELVLVDRGPDPDVKGSEVSVGDRMDALAFVVEGGLKREDILGRALGFRCTKWRFLEDVLVLKDASLPLAHLTIRFTCDVVHEDGVPVPL